MNRNVLYANLGFCILSPEHNIGKFKTTYGSIRRFYPTSEIVCAIPEGTHKDDIKETKTVLPNIHMAGNNLLSLLNVAMDKSINKWQLILIEGVIFIA